jgi:hypothetical protein
VDWATAGSFVAPQGFEHDVPLGAAELQLPALAGSGGQSHQRQPLFNTCTMPLMTRRSSARSTPRTSVGRWGSIRFHCSAQPKQVPAHDPDPFQKRIKDRIVRPEKLMSSDPSSTISKKFGLYLARRLQHRRLAFARRPQRKSGRLPEARADAARVRRGAGRGLDIGRSRLDPLGLFGSQVLKACASA